MNYPNTNDASASAVPQYEPPVRPAKLFFLTEPSRGVFIVNVQIEHTLGRIEITKDHLANFLVDGSAMALRDLTGRGK